MKSSSTKQQSVAIRTNDAGHAHKTDQRLAKQNAGETGASKQQLGESVGSRPPTRAILCAELAAACVAHTCRHDAKAAVLRHQAVASEDPFQRVGEGRGKHIWRLWRGRLLLEHCAPLIPPAVQRSEQQHKRTATLASVSPQPHAVCVCG